MLGLFLICFPSVSEGLFGQHEASTTCRIRARMSSQTTASGLRETRNAAVRRRSLRSLQRGPRTMHWNRKHLYRPSGTRDLQSIRPQLPKTESDPQFLPENTDFKGFSLPFRLFFSSLSALARRDSVRSCPQLCVLSLWFSSYLI